MRPVAQKCCSDVPSCGGFLESKALRISPTCLGGKWERQATQPAWNDGVGTPLHLQERCFALFWLASLPGCVEMAVQKEHFPLGGMVCGT
mmetsp:Transcript_117074/g.203823  ORF Transcript_117074/g.203823 Transcript_117074/m.203823 type:complete len:90 (+) Transcript_117074:1517-1786(+)